MRTGYSVIRENYFTFWNERARRARKKFLASKNHRIETVNNSIFSSAFLQTKVRHEFKKEYVTYYNALYNIDSSSVRSFLVYDDTNKILA